MPTAQAKQKLICVKSSAMPVLPVTVIIFVLWITKGLHFVICHVVSPQSLAYNLLYSVDCRNMSVKVSGPSHRLYESWANLFPLPLIFCPVHHPVQLHALVFR